MASRQKHNILSGISGPLSDWSALIKRREQIILFQSISLK